MDEDRRMAEEKLAIQKAEQSSIVKTLATFMVSAVKQHSSASVDMMPSPQAIDEIQRYTAEVKEWIADIRKTHLLPATTPLPPPQPSQPPPPQPPPPQPQLPPRALERPEASSSGGSRSSASSSELDQAYMTRLYFSDRLSDLEARLERIHGDVLLSSYTTIRDTVDEKIEDCLAAMKISTDGPESGECTPVPEVLPQHQELSQRIQTLKEEVSELSKDKTLVQNELGQCNDEVERWKAQNEAIKREQGIVRLLVSCMQRAVS